MDRKFRNGSVLSQSVIRAMNMYRDILNLLDRFENSIDSWTIVFNSRNFNNRFENFFSLYLRILFLFDDLRIFVSSNVYRISDKKINFNSSSRVTVTRDNLKNNINKRGSLTIASNLFLTREIVRGRDKLNGSVFEEGGIISRR